jgi:hypothetical protein
LKTKTTIGESIALSIIDLATEFVYSEETNFVAQAEFLNLDPTSDFRYADLSCVDFSYSNICGFDFTGSDLRGATGVNVEWDNTTILKYANTADSLFSHRLSRDRFFAENPLVGEEVQRLTGERWTGQILGVERLLSSKNKDDSAIRIAGAVFDEVNDITVRSNILFFMKRAIDSPGEYRNFLYNIFACHGGEAKIIRSAMRALRALYPHDIGAFNLMTRYLNHCDVDISTEALNGVLASRHLSGILHKVQTLLSGPEREYQRRLFLGRLARMAGNDYMQATSDPRVNNYLDYMEVITKRTMDAIAEHALISEKSRRVAAQRLGKVDDSVNVNQSEIKARAKLYRRLLEQLMVRYNVPFVFEGPVPD